jgi:large subunit ribosomal protein L32e
MSEKTKLLEVKKILKKRRPSFIREGYHKKIATKKNWRQPRGNRSKVKLERRGRRHRPKIGYRSPSEVRGLTKEGFEIIIIENLDAMKKINPILQVALIASTVGLKKRVDMLKIAKENKVTIYNYKDAEKTIQDKLKKRETKITKKKVSKKVKSVEKKEPEKVDVKTETTKKNVETTKKDSSEDEDLEEKKTEEKKKKDKVLIKAR